ncbi:hypothetical protein FB45DRAFT_1063197, partial [Roridomyces roridus]
MSVPMPTSASWSHYMAADPMNDQIVPPTRYLSECRYPGRNVPPPRPRAATTTREPIQLQFQSQSHSFPRLYGPTTSQGASLPQQPPHPSSKIDLESHVKYRTAWLFHELKMSESRCEGLQEERSHFYEKQRILEEERDRIRGERDRMKEERDGTSKVAKDFVSDFLDKTKKNRELVATLRGEHDEAQKQWKGVEKLLRTELFEASTTETWLRKQCEEAWQMVARVEKEEARLREECNRAQTELKEYTGYCRTLGETCEDLRGRLGMRLSIGQSGEEERGEIETHTMQPSSPFVASTPWATPMLRYCEPLPKTECFDDDDDLELQYPDLQDGDADEAF